MRQRVLENRSDAQTVRLEHFSELLEQMADHSALHRRSSLPQALLLASILKAGQTARGVQLLAQAGCVEEIHALGRTLVEVTVNAAYLQCAGDEELQRFIHFQPQAVYRQIALLDDGRGRVAAGVLDKIKSLMTQRSAAASRERGDPTWSRKTLLERAAAADAVGEVPVMRLLMDRVYPRGHAALHGTMDSLEPFLGRLDGSGRTSQPDRRAATADALFAVNLCLFTLCLYLNKTFDLRMETAIEDAATAHHALSALRGEVGEQEEHMRELGRTLVQAGGRREPQYSAGASRRTLLGAS